MRPISRIQLKDVSINDNFFGFYQNLIKEQVIPYQWKALNDQIEDAAPSHAINNFRIAAGLAEGEFFGCVFQDSDLAKWLEAAAYSLASFPDKDLEKIMDEAIDLIGKAQLSDGYVNTYYIVKEPGRRWTNLKDNHELYCAGHMIEAAVAYYEVTGKRSLLDIMCKYADHIDSVFGTDEGKLRGYPGHQEIELALVRLYRVTGNERYLNLSRFFLLARGTEPNFFQQERASRDGGSYSVNDLKYCQAHIPVTEQRTAEGHSVRAAYMYTAMADLALETGDEKLLEACRSLWDNIQQKRLYINGGIGSVSRIEGFTGDYDLPNDTIYAETCASIALMFFAKKMLAHERLGKYGDVMERALYNLVLAGISLDGTRFFYVNPLEANPYVIDNNVAMNHVKYERQKWFGCACCPPNVARLLASLGNYIFTKDEKGISVDLYIGSELKTDINGRAVNLKLETSMPYGGESKLTITADVPEEFTVFMRIPDWAAKYTVSVNGEAVGENAGKDGYIRLTRVWRTGDEININFDLTPLTITANPMVKANQHKAAIQRGPILYCMEEADNTKDLHQYELDLSTIREDERELLGRRIVAISVDANKRTAGTSGSGLYYLHGDETSCQPIKATFIPYHMWTNRNPGEMIVWCWKQS